ncbi:MAG: CstA-like transporter-associated (seleno)protein [Gemmatimonadales bacterium]
MRAEGESRSGEGGRGRETYAAGVNAPAPVLCRLLPALRRLLGMPDYAAYCEHLRAHHPDRSLPTEREFFDQFVRARYGDGPTRCC